MMNFEFHFKILNSDGNLHDLIVEGIKSLLSQIGFIINLESKAFVEICNQLILDPTQEEIDISDSYFCVITFGKKFFLHKISGASLKMENLDSVILSN